MHDAGDPQRELPFARSSVVPDLASARGLRQATALPPARATRGQILLFAGTVVSMLVMYPLMQLVGESSSAREALLADRAELARLLVDALVYTTTLLAILGVHEMGHFLVARRHRVDVSLPYFIPAPNLLGTFGAVIRMRSPITDRRALLMIGAAGPIAGFLVAVPAVVWGVATSEVGPIEPGSGLVFGPPLVFVWIMELWHGGLGSGQGLQLNGMAFAGWAGLFLTAFNLLPLGQLDGGHIVYALLGRRTRRLTIPLVAVLLVMGVTLWFGWALICLLVLLFGWRHPPVADPTVPLGREHRLVAALALLILVLCFTPVPIAAL
ncbi:MAG: site-2 protease family protein [Candidatus Eiseniibacteriota bacterium]|jgi:membrane-associated protease RseP (regulator of RpoE activity)